MWIILGFVLIIAAVLLIAVIRAAILKPTAAISATIEMDHSKRSMEYGEKLSRMVQCETISNRFEEDKTKFYEFHKVLEELFPNIHTSCEKHVFNGSLLFQWKGSGGQEPILLMSHQDVVEANGEWEQPPFSGKIENDLVWGRGTVDTKGSLMCILSAVEELLAQGYVPKSDIYLASSCTEEFSGEGAPLTAAYLKEQGVTLSLLLDEGGMIIPEPMPGVKGIYAMVGVLEKGYGDLKFTAKGKGGHASAPGKNTPWARLAAFICEIEKHNPFQMEFSPTAKEMFTRLAPNMKFGMKLVFGNLWLFAPLLKKLLPSISAPGAAMMRTTVAFTTGKGADGLNVLPQEAYVTANMRFIPHQPTDESIQIIKAIGAKYDVETSVIYKDYPCAVVDYKGEPFQKVEQTIQELFPGIGVSPYIMTGGTDAKYYKEVCLNCIRFAPLSINAQQYGSIHGLNENISIGALAKGVDFYKEIIRRS